MRINESRKALIGAALGGAVFLSLSISANAACFESGVGCTNDHNIPKAVLQALSCDALWTVRNMIYDENGYCFASAKALAVFSNEGCYIPAGTPVPFNAYEQTNVDRIAAVERAKGC